MSFSGDFLADTATVNNDVRHYDSSKFERVYQDPQTEPNVLHGWWNPDGGNQFGLENCAVRSGVLPGGHGVSSANADPAIGLIVDGPGDDGLGKMLDLDPQWQMSSELWCVKIQLRTAAGDVLLAGDLETAGFRDLQVRQATGKPVNGQPLGGSWTSTLKNLTWGPDAAASPLLAALRQATEGGRLSIQLNMYGFYYSHADGRFSRGRIVGTLGPWKLGDPLTFVGDRRLLGVAYRPSAGMSALQFTNFRLDPVTHSLDIDFGASFPIDDPLGGIRSTETKYVLGVALKPLSNAPSERTRVMEENTDFARLGPLPYEAGDDWLNRTAGIVTLALEADQAELLSQRQLILLKDTTSGLELIARESIDGFQLRADNFVQRLDEGDHAEVRLRTFQWGRPYGGVRVQAEIQPKVQATFAPAKTGDNTEKITIPFINTPTSGLTLGPISATDSTGETTLPLTGNRVDCPRIYLDGQVYYLSYSTPDVPADPAAYSMDAVYVHVRDHFVEIQDPTWDDIADVLTQFGNLYPLMSRFILDLSSEEAVRSRKDIMLFAFTRSIDDTFYMPVTRDLSEAKRRTIVHWLNNPKPGGSGVPERRRAAAPQAPDEGAPMTDHMRRVQDFTMRKNGAHALDSSAREEEPSC